MTVKELQQELKTMVKEGSISEDTQVVWEDSMGIYETYPIPYHEDDTLYLSISIGDAIKEY